MEVKIEKGKRIEALDGLRGIAILCVFIHHAFHVPLLWFGVDIFFVLSGFLITSILIARKHLGYIDGIKYFYKRRIRRILPPLVLLLLVCGFIFGWSCLHNWPWYLFFGTNIVSSFFRETVHPALGSLWSLAVEEQFYILWPIVVMSFGQVRLMQICFVLLVIAPVFRAIATPWFPDHFPIYYLTPFRMDLLAAGALVAIYCKHSPERLNAFRPWIVWALGAGVLALGLCLKLGIKTTDNTIISNVVIYACKLLIALSLLVWSLVGNGMCHEIIKSRILCFIGMISYSMYLIHMVAIELVKRMDLGVVISGMTEFLITVCYAVICWYGFEKKMTRT